MSTLSITKVFNLFILNISYFLFNVFKLNTRLGRPSSLSVEPTNICNLSCVECPTGTNTLKRNKGDISTELFTDIISQTKNTLLTLILYFQGEPLLYKDLFEIVRIAKANKIYTITSTNGHYLSSENCDNLIESGLDELIISLDGTTQEIYEKYRKNGDFDKVISGIRTLVESKKSNKSNTPFIALQFLAFKHNQHQINDFKMLAKKLGVDKAEIKSAQIYDYKTSTNITTISKYSRYKTVDGKNVIKNRLQNKCWRMWSSAVITWDGIFVPCCFDKDADHKFGNISEEHISAIWNSKNRHSFTNKIRTDRKSIDICRNCTEGLKIN